MNPAYAEIAAMALSILFTIYQQEKLSEEEQEKFYQEQKAKFQANKPELLPDVM